MDRRLVLFLIDGMRPDGLLRAETPVMDGLRDSGTFTMSAHTVMPSVTLPCHASLFLGVPPLRHGITTNFWTPQVRPVPGLFDVLHQAGLITASFYNWEELRDLSRPGSLNVSFMAEKSTSAGMADTAVARQAASWLKENDFNFAFVYLGGTDAAGHSYGWMSNEYLQAIAHADRCLEEVIDILPADCTLMVMSDHGGHGQTHGTDCEEDMTIPVIISNSSFSSSIEIQRQVQITDIAPTIAHYFEVDKPAEWVGQLIGFPGEAF